MPAEILMPAAAAGVEQATLLRWLKREGDPVRKGEAVAEVETDKAVMEVEAETEGTMGRLLIPAGAEGVKVGSVMALLVTQGEGLSSESPHQSADSHRGRGPLLQKQQLVGAGHARDKGVRVAASPSARHLAREKAVNLEQVQGTGPGGRVVRVDVERASEVSRKPSSGEFERLPHSGMRRTIARRLTESKQQIPHYYLSVDCRVDTLLSARQRLNATRPAGKISVNDLVVAAVARALRRVPEVNASWTEDAIHRWADVDVSIAVSTDAGLITPVIRRADTKALAELSAEIRALSAKARESRLVPSEYQGGGFTVSNLGMHGISRFSAVINPPQAAILAVGAVEKRAVVEDECVVVGQAMTLTLSADHRVIDGATGARFLQELRGLLETPAPLLA